MATYLFSQIKGTSFAFKPKTDVLNFDVGSAADVDVTIAGSAITLKLGGEWVTLLSVGQVGHFTSTNITFSDGSLLLIGDNTTGTVKDPLANLLVGGAGNDKLIGLGGGDTLDGRDGSDTYVVTGTIDGTDFYRDSGTTGVDRIVAGSNGSVIRLGSNFSNALTGIDAISANSYSGVNVVGTTGADTLDFSGVSLNGLALIDAQGGADTVLGSAGDDRISGGAGNDAIDGGAGPDSAVFAGTRASYSITTAGAIVTVRDLDASANGDDGIDTLRGVESLRFLDSTVSLSAPSAVADSANVDASRAQVAIDVLANDTDIDTGDTQRVITVDPSGLKGNAWAAPDGSRVMYSPGNAFQSLRADATATETFSYTMSDSIGGLSSASVAVTITGMNDGPVAYTDSATTAADSGAITIDVLANDTDVDIGDTKAVTVADGSGRPASFEIVVGGTFTFPVAIPAIPAIKGAATVAQDGQGIVYNPGDAFASLGAGQTATEIIIYTMTDGAGAQATALATVTVTGVNDAPVARDDAVTVASNAAAFTIDVLGNDSDPDAGDTKTIKLDINGTAGVVAIADDGQSVVYTAAAGAAAPDSFGYTIFDSAGAASTARVAVTIVGANTAPVAVEDTAGATENGAPIQIDVLANDKDADLLDTNTVLSVDNTGTRGTASVSPGDAGVSYAVGNAFQSLRAGATATDTFTYTMADRNGAQSSAIVSVTVTGVNDAVIAVADGGLATEDGGTVLIDVRTNDVDIDQGDTLTVVGLTKTGLKGSVVIAEGGSGVTYTPYQSLRAGQTGTDTFSYTVSDGSAQSTATVTMTVTGANDAPIAVANSASVSEDAAPTTIAVLANDTDADLGDTKHVVAVTPSTGMKGTVSIAANGSGVIYSPGNAFQHLLTGKTETETFTYTMEDALGAKSTSTVTVTVNGVTDGLRAVSDNVSAVSENSGTLHLNVLSNDFNDVTPNDAFTVTAIDSSGQYSQPILGFFDGTPQLIGFAPGFPRTLGDARIGADGRSIDYTPLQSLNAGETGVDKFVYTIAGSGGSTSSAVVSVTVTGVNDTPEAFADEASIAADGAPITIDVLANDTDPDTRVDPPAPVIPQSDFSELIYDPTPVDVADTKIVVSAVAIPGTTLQGSVAPAAGGTGVVYKPGGTLLELTFGQTATETFTYTMRDAAGAESSADVSVTVTGANHSPTASDDTAEVFENGAPVTINVLANDRDTDIGAGDALRLALNDVSTLRGSASVVGTSVVYDAGNAFQSLGADITATDHFSYLVTDSRGATVSANVAVTVTGVNEAPVAADDAFAVSEDEGAATIGVLWNDTDVDQGDGKTIVSVNKAGLQGDVTFDGSSVSYTVGSGFQSLLSGQTATDTFTYTMRDDAGEVSTASVAVTIVGANEPVVIVSAPAPGPGAIVGTAGNDILGGTSGADIIYGQDGDDDISAGNGADTLYGGANDDTLGGGAGDDILVGGTGRDDLTGGAGNDTFRFYTVTESNDPTKPDRIRDFSNGDKIDLSLIDANTVLGGNDAFTLSSAFTGAAGQLIVTFDPITGSLVRGDVNGDAVADFVFSVDKVAVTGLDLTL